MLYTIVGMLVIILDQVVKFWVDKNITYANPVKNFIPGVVSLVRVQNDGAAFSFLAGGGARVWFIVLTGIFTLIVVLALATNFISGKFGRWCLVLVTAGGLSNCIDRILYGYVLDMFKVELFNFAVFNVADIFITVFAILFILYILFGGEKEPDDDADEFDEEDVDAVKQPLFAPKTRRERVVREDISEEEERPVARPSRAKMNANNYRELATNRSASARDVNANSVKNMAASKEFEDFFAQRRAPEKPARPAAPKAPSAPVERPAVKPVPAAAPEPPKVDSADPFAEWDRANGVPAAAPVVEKVVEQVSRPVEPVYEKIEKVEEKVEDTVSSFDDYDLDSIMNEFK